MYKALIVIPFVAIVLIASMLPAHAWTNFGNFTNTTQWWTPNNGVKWGQFAVSGGRKLHADAADVRWDQSRTTQLQSGGDDPQTVFHIFQKNTNCSQPFNFTGYWWSNIPGTYKFEKWAGCFPQLPGPNNELRIYYPRFNIVANQNYDVGGEFLDQGGGSLDGEVNYDTYYSTNKQNHGKWCFDGNNNMYPPNPTNGTC